MKRRTIIHIVRLKVVSIVCVTLRAGGISVMAEFPDDYNDKLYEIVWAPFSGSPWWPALTYHPDEVPAQAKQMWLKKGEKRFEYYPVRFYKQLNFSVAKWTGLKSWHENFEKFQNGVVRGKKKAITAKVRADLKLAIAEARVRSAQLAKLMTHTHTAPG